MTKHIATYPLYASNPITGATLRRRIGTGYIYRPEEIKERGAHLERYGHPLHLRWRNEECRQIALDFFANNLATERAASHPHQHGEER